MIRSSRKSTFRNIAFTALALATTSALAGSGLSAGNAGMGAPVARATALRPGDAVNGVLPATQPMHIVVALQLRNRDQLDRFLASAMRPDAVQRTMAPGQFDAQHAPTQAQADAVANYLTRMGFRNVAISPSRMLVSADGTAATARAAFLTTFVRVKTKDGRIAYANNSDAQIPAALKGIVLSVIGLQDVHRAHPFIRRAQPVTDAQTQAIMGHNPLEFSSIYGATGVPTASGVTVGIITQGKLTQTIADLNTYTTNNSLAAVTTQTVNTNGTSTDTSGVIEWDLDSQDIVGMGGGQVGKIIFYNIPTLSTSDLTADIDTAVTANVAKIINVSLGLCETDAQGDGSAAAQDALFQTAMAHGQTFAVSTGDSGADECGDGGITPSYPASSPFVVAVGGTRLNATTTTYTSETVWSGSGGSPSTFEPRQTWQAGVVPGTKRGLPDIAFDGDPSSGAQFIFNGTLSQAGGTSLSAPIFAGAWARLLAAHPTLGFAAPYLYNILTSVDYHDVTSGSNGGETAAAGWDNASGFGSFILSNVNSHIAGAGPPSLSVSDVAITEGDSGTKLLNFTVNLSSASSSSVSFKFATADGTATAGSDYVARALTSRSIAAGLTSSVIGVTVNGDTTAEPDETLFLNISNPVGATIADGQGLGTIQTDDIPSLSVTDVSITEGNSGTKSANFTVSLTSPSATAVSFKYATADGTATAGSDYVARALTGRTIAAGLTSTQIGVTLNGDTTVEPDETFFLNLSNPVGAAIADSQGLGTIQNDDAGALPTLSVSDVSITEGNSGTKSANFTVTLSAPSASAVSFKFATAEGTATAGSDYVARALTNRSIAAGLTSTQIGVTLNGDATIEPNETFFLNISNPSGATISDSQGQGTIQNDD